MKYDHRCCTVLLSVLLLGAVFVDAQNLDENGLVVAEDLLIDEAVAGQSDEQPPADEPATSGDVQEVVPLPEEPVVAEGLPPVESPDSEALEAPIAESEAAALPPIEVESLDALPVAAEPVESESVEEPISEEKGAADLGAIAAEEGTVEAEVPVDLTTEEKPVETWDDAVTEVQEPAAPSEPVAEVLPVTEVVEPVEAGLDELVTLPTDDALSEEVPVPEEETAPQALPAPETSGVSPDVFGEVADEALAEGVVPAPAVPAAAVQAPQEPGWAPSGEAMDIPVVMEVEIARRGAIEQYAQERLLEAQTLFRKDNCRDAVSQFEKALTAMDSVAKRPENEELRRNIRNGIRAAYYRWAEQLLKAGDLEQANKVAERARDVGHQGASELIGRIKEKAKEPVVAKPPAVAPLRWKEEDFKEQRASVAARIKRGREFFAVGEIDKAQSVFEGIMAEDPYNTEALRWLQKIAQSKYDVAASEFDVTRRQMIADARDTWNPRTYDASSIQLPGPKPSAQPRTPVLSDQKLIMDKMSAIEIPEVDFRQANINDVIQFLQEASRDFDNPSLPERDRGVNLILNLQAGVGGRAPAAAKPADPFATEVESAAGGGDVPLITFAARHISLAEALNIVTQVSGLKYYVQGKVVMIVPISAATEDMVTRVYDVLSSVAERVRTTGEELGGGSSRETGGFTQLESSSVGTEYADFKETFAAMGVDWPAGSSIRHVPTIGKLIVKNTPQNLLEVEKVLEMLNVVPKQIEIEARFVEVSQADLDSIGVQWGLTDDWELAAKKSGSGPLASQQKIVIAENGAEGGFTKGLRYMTDGIGAAGDAVSDDVFQIGGILTNPELSAILHLLSQKGSTDLLSAPKVTTQNEMEASIKVVTEYIYPTDFTIEPLESQDEEGNIRNVGGLVEPGSFETREVGVILRVVPRLSPEGQMIELTMNPQVVSDPEWYDYGSTFTAPDGTVTRLNIQQPFFHTREIATTISIYNGATVVMGGMITENRVEVEDKIPFFGDIPLVGRLFQSRYEQSDKRNLLIFVTARLVDPAGRFTSFSQEQALGDNVLNPAAGNR